MSSRLLTISLAVAAAFGLWLARPAHLAAIDQEQPRLNQPAPIPHGPEAVGQTFVAAHDGLSAVDLVTVVYPDSPTGAALTLRLLDAHGRVLAANSFSSVAHNAPLRLDFGPLPDSAGKTFTLVLDGTPDNQTTVWAYSLDGYAHGTRLENGAPAPGDLRFTTMYSYLWTDALRNAVTALGRLTWLALPLWLILFAPGLLVAAWLDRGAARLPTRWARWGMALGFSLSLLALAWLWLTAVGLRWSASGLHVVYALMGVTVAGRAVYQALKRLKEWAGRKNEAATGARASMGLPIAVSGHDLAMMLILLAGLAARLLAVRDLAFPQWVDSPHHLTITRLFAESGRVPVSYLPLLPIEQFMYHFGFHVLAATVHGLAPLPLTDVLLLLGQILNALAPLAAYTFVVGLTTRPRAGLVAAFFIAFVSLFPGYYVSWGRYPQLTGVLILAPALVVAWRMVQPRAEGWAAPGLANVVAVGLLSSGLLLTHYSVLALVALFVLAALAAGGRGGWKWMGAAAVLGALFSLPWLLRLGALAGVRVLQSPALMASPSGYNAFPVDYFRAGMEPGWIAAALLATTWGLVRRERMVWLTAGWVSLTFAVVNIGPGSWLVPNSAWAITLFLPGALVLGWGADQWLRHNRVSPASDEIRNVLSTGCGLSRWRVLVGMVMLSSFVGMAAYAGLRGFVGQISISNPTTVLATGDDLSALEWVAQHTPADAVFLVNGWDWLNGTWAGSDGGIWLWPLTGRRTTLPPIDYAYAEQREWFEQINAFNARAAKIQDASAPETLALLQEAGVTHVFIGARGGTLKPEMFVDNPNYGLLYTNGAAWVFEVMDVQGTPVRNVRLTQNAG